MDYVYCLFSAHGEGDGYTEYSLVGVYRTLEGARAYPAAHLRPAPSDYNMYPVHKSMTKQNNYTYVGCRTDAALSTTIPYNCFGGYVVEKTYLDD